MKVEIFGNANVFESVKLFCDEFFTFYIAFVFYLNFGFFDCFG